MANANDGLLRRRQTQVALTAFLSLLSLVGLSYYGLPFFYDFMVKEFGWSRATVTSGNAVAKIVVGPLFGYLAGWIIDRFGPRRLMLTGIVMGGMALIGLSQMTSLWMLYVAYLFNALGYVCGGPLPNQVLLARWFDRGRGRAMGFAYLGIGIGGTLVPLVGYWLTTQLGWRGALFTLGIATIAIALPMVWIVPESPDARAERRERTPSPSIAGALRSGPFYLLAIGSMASIAAVGGTNQHLKLFLSLDQGYAQGAAARVISLVLASSIAGRLIMGWLADRFPKKYVMLLIYLLVAAGIPLLFVASTPGVIYLFAIVFGIGVGGDYMIIPLMAAELFGVRLLGRLMGVILTADGVADATAPMLVGWLHDKQGSYVGGFTLLIALALVGAVAIAMLPRQIAPTDRAAS
ncbi:MAG: MFS transporter [Gemmatimonadaceae bacterium]